MPACLAVIDSIGSNTWKFVSNIRAQAMRYFVFELEKKMEIRVDDLKVTLVFQKGRLLLILFFKRVLKSSDTLQENSN